MSAFDIESFNYFVTPGYRDPVSEFEALVLAQQPASRPWAPVTDYSFESRKQIEGKHPQLIKDTFAPVFVLDVGCGPDEILVRLLEEIDVVAGGEDVQHPNPMKRLDIAADLDSSLEGRPDLVICREVLEHLTILQIRKAVTNLCALSSKFVYVTTRFAKHPQSLLDVDTSDDLDPTHISMLNQDLLRVLFVLEGFKRRADLEMKLDWQQKCRCLVYERAV